MFTLCEVSATVHTCLPAPHQKTLTRRTQGHFCHLTFTDDDTCHETLSFFKASSSLISLHLLSRLHTCKLVIKMTSYSTLSLLEVRGKSKGSSPPSSPSPLFRTSSSSITSSPSTSTSEDSNSSDLQWRRKQKLNYKSNQHSQPSFSSINLLPPLLLVILLPLYLLSTFPACSANPNPNPSQQSTTTSSRVVKTKYGALRGFYINFPNKALPPVEAFLGIPYASPPVGKLRFMPPVTPALWTNTRAATSFGPVCPQRLPGSIANETEALGRMTRGRLKVLRRLYPMLSNQSEDCLYLNIYAVASATREMTRLPVLMFIHGESYEWNAGSTVDGSVLASATDMVVVTINFRLGILGFFPSPGGSARGNFGLMDQVAALHWIQENIREFGGDERNVTIMGHGTGAACVNFLMLSPMARGLFHRAIMASGSALSPWAIATDAVVHGQTVAKAVGCMPHQSTSTSDQASSSNPQSPGAVLECLRERTVEELNSVALSVPTHLTAFGPIIDGIVLPADPVALMSRGGTSANKHMSSNSAFSTYALLFGVTRVEGGSLGGGTSGGSGGGTSSVSTSAFLNAADERHGVEVGRRDRLLRTLVRNLYSYHLQEIFYTLVNEYTDWTRPFLHPISLLDSLVALLGDALVVAPAVRVGLLHSAKNSGNSGSGGTSAPAGTYFYSFSHQTEAGDYSPRLGAVHGQELAYLFGAPLINGYQLAPAFPLNYTRAEVALSEAFMRLVANFARTGNPNNNQTSEGGSGSYVNVNKGGYPTVFSEENFYWPPYEEIQQKYVAFGTKVSTSDHYLAHRLSYWFNLLPQLHKPGSGTEHHLLDSHNNPLSYEGIVRYGALSPPIAFETYFSAESGLVGQLMASNFPGGGQLVDGKAFPTSGSTTFNQSRFGGKLGSSNFTSSTTSGGKSASDLRSRLESEGNASFSMIVQSGNYSAALSLIIAIGVSLLVLNLLVFAGILYKKGKNRLETKLESKKSMSLQTLTKTSNINRNNGNHHPNHHGLSTGGTSSSLDQQNSFSPLCSNLPSSTNSNNSSNVPGPNSMYRINSITDDYHNQRGGLN